MTASVLPFRRLLGRSRHEHQAIAHLVGTEEAIAAIADDIEAGRPVVVTFRRPQNPVRCGGDTWQLTLDVRTAAA